MSRTYHHTKKFRENVMKMKHSCVWTPPAWFRRELERQRRAKVKQAMRTGEEIPIFKRDVWWHWW